MSRPIQLVRHSAQRRRTAAAAFALLFSTACGGNSDPELPFVISRWRYQPYLMEGQPTPFCYDMNYRVR